MTTAATIFAAVFIKGLFLAVAYKRGWMRTPEQYVQDYQEEKAVLLAYKEWRKNAGPKAAADLSRRLASRYASRRTRD